MSLDRRNFLFRAAAIGCSAAASPLVTPVAFASAPTENRLVVLILRGGMDGLAALQPLGDPGFAALRPETAASGGAHDLDGFFALHPALGDLMPLWRAGELSFAHAVSTPYRDLRSHFDGQDLLEAGLGNEAAGQRHADGWLNRLVQTLPGATRETALAVGREEMLILKGPAGTISWSPEARIAISPAAEALLGHLYHDDVPFRDAFDQAILLSDEMFGDFGAEGGAGEAEMRAAMRESMGNPRRAEATEEVVAFTAERLLGAARIASFSIGGWDTHRQQEAQIGRALGQLSATILGLKRALGPVWGRTTVLAMTEFGRTARMNGTAGTDHGTGGAMLIAGGAVNGGRVLTRWPGLAEADLYERRDLMPTGDVRAYAAWAMAGLFGTGRATLESAIFPGLDMGAEPGLLR